MPNLAPDWSRSFIWRLCPPDTETATEDCARAIAAVQNLLDNSIRSVVITSGFIGCDTGTSSWDGSWPYWNRATYRVKSDWQVLADFMTAMRDKYDAWISFHTNITDVNVGLAHYPEMRAFFERMVAHRCCYTREVTGCGGPYLGEAAVPDHIPVETAKMPYVPAGDASDIFAIVDYQRFWDSGLAREMLDAFFAHLPYAPPVLYVDVLSLTGNNCNVGYPDGQLGGSAATQAAGRKAILDHIRSKGTEPGGEGPGDWTAYNWNHGGLSTNDYRRIQSGYSQGCCTWRGEEPMHVYGNQGAYSLDLTGKLLNRAIQFATAADGGALMTGFGGTGAPKLPYQPLEEWRTLPQVIEGFYLTVIQELYHIGKGNTRRPGGPGLEREDEHRGRLRIDSYTLRHNDGFAVQLAARDGHNTGPLQLVPQARAAHDRVVAGLELALSGSNTVTVSVPRDGTYTLIVRYFSDQGGTAELWINDAFHSELDFPATVVDVYPGDLAVKLTLTRGTHQLTLRKGCIHASWSDGTQARWDRYGFKAWNGEVVFGIGYDRMWPDTWSGQRKIYFYSKDGCARTWTLPEEWADITKATLYSLTAGGRTDPQPVTVIGRRATVRLAAGIPYVLIQAGDTTNPDEQIPAVFGVPALAGAGEMKDRLKAVHQTVGRSGKE